MPVGRSVDEVMRLVQAFQYTDIHGEGNIITLPLQWRHNGHSSVSNHQLHDCLLNRFFRRRSKKTLKLRVTGLCAGNSPGTGEVPAQMASNAENVSIWWCHHDSNVKWPPRYLHSLTSRSFVQADIKGDIKAPLTGPVWRESTGHRWIPLTKGQ